MPEKKIEYQVKVVCRRWNQEILLSHYAQTDTAQAVLCFNFTD